MPDMQASSEAETELLNRLLQQHPGFKPGMAILWSNGEWFFDSGTARMDVSDQEVFDDVMCARRQQASGVKSTRKTSTQIAAFKLPERKKRGFFRR